MSYANVKVIETVGNSTVSKQVLSADFTMVAYNTPLPTYTVSAGIEFSLDSSYANTIVTVEGLTLFNRASPDTFTNYIAVITPGALLQQASTDVPLVDTTSVLVGKNNSYSLFIEKHPLEYGQVYRWGVDDIGGLLQLDSSAKISVCLTHLEALSYTGVGNANNLQIFLS